MADLLFKEEVYAIIGAAMEVYNQLSPGFLENVYQEAMELESDERKIPNKPRQEIFVKYKGKTLKKFYLADLIGYGKIIVELKAVDHLSLRDEGQLLNYMKATGFQVGVLINFGSFPSLEWKRLILTKEKPLRESYRGLQEDSPVYQTPISED
jgi:GxxExxY protein